MTRPFLLMVAGPNGAGKTTLTSFLKRQNLDFGKYINPDDLAACLPGCYDERVRSAQTMADKLRDECIKNLQSFSFETVMSHPSKLEILSRGKQAGFHTTLYFVGTDDPKTNIDRVAARVRQGGHDVPPLKITDRWARTMQNLRPAMSLADVSYVFDNSSVDKGPRLILSVETNPEVKGRRVAVGGIPGWVMHYALWPQNLTI